MQVAAQYAAGLDRMLWRVSLFVNPGEAGRDQTHDHQDSGNQETHHSV